MIRNIYVLCPDNPVPTGGMKTLYRHAEILSREGFSAVVVHSQKGFRCGWFKSEVRILSIPELRPTPGDVLVLPEIFSHAFRGSPPPRGRRRRWAARLGRPRDPMPWRPAHELLEAVGRAVILNLNPYNTFRGWSPEGPPDGVPYLDGRVIAALTISRDAERYLRHAFPGLPVARFTKAVDPERFAPAERKEPLVAFMPRKKAEEVVQVLGMLRLRGALRGFTLAPIADRTEAEVAQTLARASVFLSFSHAEGLPRPPMEAMLAGCVVVGYHGRGGREYFDPEHCVPVEEGDVVGFAEAAERVLVTLRKDSLAYEALRVRARRSVAERYSPAAEVREVAAFWRRLEAGEPGDPTSS